MPREVRSDPRRGPTPFTYWISESNRSIRRKKKPQKAQEAHVHFVLLVVSFLFGNSLLRPGLQICLHEGIEISIEHAADVTDLHFSARIFDNPIWLENVRANLIAESDIEFAVFDRLRICLLLFHFEFE